MPERDARPARGWIPLIVAATFFMENLDSTIIATALPVMARSFGQEAAALNVGITAYVLSLAACIPLSAWVADRFGTRNVFASAIVVFVAASVACGASHSLGQFVLARVAQGVGGAMMVPVGRMIVLRTTDKAQMMRAIATLTWPALVAPVVGPSVGGFIATYLDWRWIFYLNVPVGALGLGLAWRFIPNLVHAHARPFDGGGFLLTSLGLGGLVAGLGWVSQATRPGALGSGAALAAAGAGLCWAALRHMRRHPHPLVDLQPFSVPSFRLTQAGGAWSRTAVSAGLFLLPLMFQLAYGMTAFAAGLLMLVGAVGSLGTKAFAIAVVRRFGFRSVLLVNGTLIALATAACLLLAPGRPLPLLVAVMLGLGLTRSLQFTCINALSFADMEPARMGAASMLSSMVQQLVMGLGVASAALMIQALAWMRAPTVPGVPPGEFHIALLLVGALALLGLPFYRRLPADAGIALAQGRRVSAQAGRKPTA